MSDYYDEVPRCLGCDSRLFEGRGTGHFCHDCEDEHAIDGFDGIPDDELARMHCEAVAMGDTKSARLYGREVSRRLALKSNGSVSR